MVVDALMQIPFLAAIIGHVVATIKLLWELVGKAARQVAAWAAFFVPWVARQAAKSIANRLVIVGIWFGLLQLAWRGVVSLAGNVLSAAVPWAAMATESNVIVSWIWNSPLNLRSGFEVVLPTVLAAQSAAYSLRVIYRRLSWAVLVKRTS